MWCNGFCPKYVYKFRTCQTPSTFRREFLARISAGRARDVWTAADFADLGTRDAIDKPFNVSSPVTILDG